ncbi:MAG: monooxygenase, partial [Candidatus Nanopelagicales bacterium]
AADGLHSTLRSGLGLSAPPSKHPRYGLRQHFALAPWTTAVEVYWAAHSEAYVTPVDSQVVGVALLVDRVGGDFDHRLGEFPALLERLDGAPRIGSVLGAGPLRQVARRRVQGRIALVGDAAGYVDALTGEGLAIGFESARVLIEAMLADDLMAYERSWRRITRRYRVLTLGLLAASRNPWVRDRIVPASARLPRVFGAAVNSLA